MQDLYFFSKTSITRINLALLVFYFQFLLRGRNKPRNILPWPNSSFSSKKFKGTPNVSIDVVTKPNKNLGIKAVYCIPDGLQSINMALKY